jgi:predicted glutamine amidotransferase
MARLVGFIGNRPDLGSRAIALEEQAFMVRVPEVAEGAAAAGDEGPGSVSWGIGFYQGGEILLKRRPFDERRALSLGEILKDVKGEVLIGHVRTATIGSLRTENTHPFRYRQWLFAQTGTVPTFNRLRGRLMESMPQFLARDVRGDTDAEIVFHLFLSFLHDGGMLDRPDVDPASARDAIRSTLSLVDGLCAEEGQGPTRLNLVLACGDYVVGVRCSANMGYQVVAGRAALERLFGGESLSRTKIPHLASARLSMCASDFDDDRLPNGWTAIPERSTVTLSHAHDPQVSPL